MRTPPSLTETYVVLAAPIATLLVLPVGAAVVMALAMVWWVLARWGNM